MIPKSRDVKTVCYVHWYCGLWIWTGHGQESLTLFHNVQGLSYGKQRASLPLSFIYQCGHQALSRFKEDSIHYHFRECQRAFETETIAVVSFGKQSHKNKIWDITIDKIEVKETWENIKMQYY